MNNFISKLKTIYGESVQVNTFLATYTKVGIGGQAKYFLPCNDLESFNQATETAKKNSISYLTIKFNDDVLIGVKMIEQLVIFLINPQSNQPKTITLFQPVTVDNDIKKILVNKKFDDFIINNKFLSPDNIFFKLGLVDKVFGGLKQIPESPNIAINFKQATVDDVIIMSSYLKQQVRDKLGIQLKDNYKLIADNN